ncbi:MAG: helix-turn-helix domain-containing protein [Spirochaetes bacterium]|nr:helix-turn-helix domain-containing protein [Spirochaetota bacterium]
MSQTIGKRIRIRRKELGYSQRQIAKKLDIGQSTYSRIEREIIRKEEILLYKISDALRCIPYELLFPDIRIQSLNDEEKEILELYDKLPPRMQLIIKELLKEWVKHGRK